RGSQETELRVAQPQVGLQEGKDRVKDLPVYIIEKADAEDQQQDFARVGQVLHLHNNHSKMVIYEKSSDAAEAPWKRYQKVPASFLCVPLRNTIDSLQKGGWLLLGGTTYQEE
ncbi:MAG: hypothetical protein AAB356_00205, partial [Deltaproteobacteria bacterium]